MERIKLFTAALLLAAISAGNDVWALSDSRKKDTRPVESPQFFSGNANPLLDFIFVADPTSVEYNGRLYVYGTNDTQQLGQCGKIRQKHIPIHPIHWSCCPPMTW